MPHLLLIMLVLAGSCVASDMLRITSPATATTVNPGQTITITVAANPGVTSIGVMTPLAEATETSVPLQFSLTIPTNKLIDQYNVQAWGSFQGQPASSAPISLNLESAFSLVSIEPDSNTMEIPQIGTGLPIHVIGTFADGSQADISRSVNTSYASANPSVATVNKQGVVTAVASGATNITITTSVGTATVTVTVGTPRKRVSFFFPLSELPQARLQMRGMEQH